MLIYLNLCKCMHESGDALYLTPYKLFYYLELRFYFSLILPYIKLKFKLIYYYSGKFIKLDLLFHGAKSSTQGKARLV